MDRNTSAPGKDRPNSESGRNHRGRAVEEGTFMLKVLCSTSYALHEGPRSPSRPPHQRPRVAFQYFLIFPESSYMISPDTFHEEILSRVPSLLCFFVYPSGGSSGMQKQSLISQRRWGFVCGVSRLGVTGKGEG